MVTILSTRLTIRKSSKLEAHATCRMLSLTCKIWLSSSRKTRPWALQIVSAKTFWSSIFCPKRRRMQTSSSKRSTTACRWHLLASRFSKKTTCRYSLEFVYSSEFLRCESVLSWECLSYWSSKLRIWWSIEIKASKTESSHLTSQASSCPLLVRTVKCCSKRCRFTTHF